MSALADDLTGADLLTLPHDVHEVAPLAPPVIILAAGETEPHSALLSLVEEIDCPAPVDVREVVGCPQRNTTKKASFSKAVRFSPPLKVGGDRSSVVLRLVRVI